jgi:phenylalanyl-tRNA synthetase beta chain
MKISYNWLKQYLDIDMAPSEVADILTSTGLEVEDVIHWESIKGGMQGVVIGEVLTCAKHPNADKLSVTTVDIGNETILPIVCGASNVAAGQKVVVAKPGTMIYKGAEQFEIKKAKIRGEVSEGMICAEDEIGIGDSHDGIMVLPNSAIVGTPAALYFDIEEDIVFEIGLTPNRSDATSHIGVARDLMAALNFREGRAKYSMCIPQVEDKHHHDNSLDIEVVVDDPQACPRYSGLTISGIRVAESPAWLQNRLNAIGLRPINNIVDITNFVMFETGQPLHAFDAAAITGNQVVVTKLPEGTPFLTLDGQERRLNQDNLMICNSLDPMCIGGVFGGQHSGVSSTTQAIFLESACFESKSIRRTARFHALQTDASFRFERGSDPNITVYALKRAAELIVSIAGGRLSSEIKDVYPIPVEMASVRLSLDYLNKIAGQPINPEAAAQILTDLGIVVEKKDESHFDTLVPTFKPDVYRQADLVEEVLRIYGYNNIHIPEKLNASLNIHTGIDVDAVQNLVADMLSSKGFYEIMNNSLTKSAYIRNTGGFLPENNVVILNPLSSELDVLRQTLLFGGLETIAYNQNRKHADLKLYEFGKTYHYDPTQSNENGNDLAPYGEAIHLDMFLTGQKSPENWHEQNLGVDFFDLKAHVEMVLKRINIPLNKIEMVEIQDVYMDFGLIYRINGLEIARFGMLSQKILKDFEIKKEVYYASLAWETLLTIANEKSKVFREVTKFPAARRDLALVLDISVRFEDISKIAYAVEPGLLTAINLFDVYQGDKIPQGKKSYAISFVLLDSEKTLTDKVIDNVMGRLIKQFEEKLGAVLR